MIPLITNVAKFEDVFSNDQLRQSSAPKAYHPQTLIWLLDAPTSGAGSVWTRAYHLVESKEADVLLGQTSPEAVRGSHSSGDFFLPRISIPVRPSRNSAKPSTLSVPLARIVVRQGSYTGGHLVLPELGIRIDQQPGDVTIMHACVLIHTITEIYGNRMCNSELTFLKHLRGPANKDDNVRAKAKGSKA
ncbi:MAG: hypothetical protein Q9188_004015 [Gyalolechia gomerana]